MRPGRRARRVGILALISVPLGTLYLCWTVVRKLPIETRHILSQLDVYALPPFRSTLDDLPRKLTVLQAFDGYLAEYPVPSYVLPVNAAPASRYDVDYAETGSIGNRTHDHKSSRRVRKPAKGASPLLLLKLDYPTSLGLNNIRWTLEWALYLAQLLGRKLILPEKLRLHDPVFCFNASLCQQFAQLANDGPHGETIARYWLPFDAFFDVPRLQRAGGILPADLPPGPLGPVLTCRDIFQGRFYADDELWVERLPEHLRTRWLSAQNGVAPAGSEEPIPAAYPRFSWADVGDLFRHPTAGDLHAARRLFLSPETLVPRRPNGAVSRGGTCGTVGAARGALHRSLTTRLAFLLGRVPAAWHPIAALAAAATALAPRATRGARSPIPPLHATVRRIDLHDEVTYAFGSRPRAWASDAGVALYGFSDQFGNLTVPVLHLGGDAMRGSFSPVVWSSPESLATFNLVRLAVRYPPQALAAARAIVAAVWGNMPYVAVHYRRGDLMATASAVQHPAWVAELVKRVSAPGDSPRFYIATESGEQLTRCAPWGCKRDAAIGAELSVLEAAGGVRWPHVATHAGGEPRLALGDWVGMVEQVLCAGARFFVGSDRSTVSGGVLNLRLELFGTAEPFYLMPSK